MNKRVQCVQGCNEKSNNKNSVENNISAKILVNATNRLNSVVQ